MRFLLTVLFTCYALLLTACTTTTPTTTPTKPLASAYRAQGSSESQTPKAIRNDACALLQYHPHWRDSLRAAYQKWRIEPWFVLAFMYQESSFNPQALSASQAYGLPQAKDETWDWYILKRPTTQAASRENFADSVDFMGFYVNKNQQRNGVAINDVRHQYLAYHEGMGGFEEATHQQKPWLLLIADKVVEQAKMYQIQLFDCPIF